MCTYLPSHDAGSGAGVVERRSSATSTAAAGVEKKLALRENGRKTAVPPPEAANAVADYGAAMVETASILTMSTTSAGGEM